MTWPLEIRKHVLSWSINATKAPHTEVRIDFAYEDASGECRYAVRANGGLCINKLGEWVPDEIPVSTVDPWLDDHRFELWQAEVLAYAAARELAIRHQEISA